MSDGHAAAAETADRTDRASDPDTDPDIDPDIDPGNDDVELAVVTMRFDAADEEALLAVLSKYVVLTRMVDGCRNVDLCSSVTRPGRHLIVQKWDSPDHQRAHFDSDLMIEMARSCTGILSAPPDIDLWDGTSAHDLA